MQDRIRNPEIAVHRAEHDQQRARSLGGRQHSLLAGVEQLSPEISEFSQLRREIGLAKSPADRSQTFYDFRGLRSAGNATRPHPRVGGVDRCVCFVGQAVSHEKLGRGELLAQARRGRHCRVARPGQCLAVTLDQGHCK